MVVGFVCPDGGNTFLYGMKVANLLVSEWYGN